MLVMTPAILNALIAEGTVPFDAISLLIFDEAHHCTKNHPYADIMRKYHELPPGSDKPKIFGMTASPVNTRAGTHEKMKKNIQELQDMMDARLKTVSDVAQVCMSTVSPICLRAEQTGLQPGCYAFWVQQTQLA
jgi:endoribonuclease Dicer